MQAVQEYLKDVARKHAKGNATEHTYRESLVNLSNALLKNKFELTNEPKRQACGAPDFILENGDIPIGYIEAKDIGVSLDKTEDGEQMARYLRSLDNLILTDYMEFRFFRKGEKTNTISIGKLKGGKVVPSLEDPSLFVSLFENFATYRTQTITSAKYLSEMMAKKAVLVKDVFSRILASEEPSGLHDQYDAFKQVLLHSVTPDEFADIYAETLAYGLFTARLHDKTPDTFSREEAYRLIPRSNPFLRELFTYVGTKLDDRAAWIVDELCDVFRATNVQALLSGFNRGTGRDDPFLHFYETFLGQYNPAKKKSRGVWYTPEPVVNFIVRAVDEILIDKFALPDGLADIGTTKVEVDTQRGTRRGKTNTVKVEKEVHRVQILDVATGTGTFLAETVAQIHQKFQGQQGLWSSYVEEHLIPRLYGFELLMASYSMCHMKLELLLAETGYKPKSLLPPRLNVYLTNSLQKADEEVDKLPLIEWFSRESNEASYIKKYSPIMVAIGNPPYSGLSSNMGKLIVDIEDYKYVDGVHFDEKKHWLHDDYVKFIRLGEHFIEKNGDGVLGYITNHSYLDNPTFRGMRWHLLKTFNSIYILDLHGNAKKNEKSPDGSTDRNVFDIQQGVSIIVAIKQKGKRTSKLAQIFHADVWGSRDSKYEFLRQNNLRTIEWRELSPQKPYYFFVPKNNDGEDKYAKGFKIDDLFVLNGVGVVTARDEFVIDQNKTKLLDRMRRAAALPTEDARQEFGLRKDVDSWKVNWAQNELRRTGPSGTNIHPVAYRPFDIRHIYYTDRSSGILARPNSKIMKHFIDVENVGMMVSKQQKASGFSHVLVHENVIESSYVSNRTSEIGYTFPLYIYETDGLELIKEPNFRKEVWDKIKKRGGNPANDPQNVFDYIYAVLHSPGFRTKYKEFLKSDFPRIPFPANENAFLRLTEVGAELRRLHLFRHAGCTPSGNMAAYPVDGSDLVSKAEYISGNIWINDTQYFSDVPEEAWIFVVGAYQPAAKWIKDRKGMRLSLNEIRHYQKIISTLSSTATIMSTIDELLAI